MQSSSKSKSIGHSTNLSLYYLYTDRRANIPFLFHWCSFSVVLGKLYQKLFIHSLVPCYAQRDVDVDETIEIYHRYLFSLGGHRGIDSGSCLASTEGPLLTETLKKLGLSEKMRSMRVDIALDGAAGLFRAWDQQSMDDTIGLMTAQRTSTPSVIQETDQERKRRELRDSLRVFVQDNKPKSESRASNRGFSPEPAEDTEDDEEQDSDYVWNTPLEKVICIKQVLDTIAIVAEDHLMNGQGAGFLQRKRSGTTLEGMHMLLPPSWVIIVDTNSR